MLHTLPLGVNRFFTQTSIASGETKTIDKGYVLYLITYVRGGDTGLYTAQNVSTVEYVAGYNYGANVSFSKTEYATTITNNLDAAITVITIGLV